MAIALFDSNILIDALNGLQQAMMEIAYYQHIAISSVTWMELMAKPLAEQRCGKISTLDMQRMRRFIQATALVTGRLLVTRNKKDFRGANLRIPYELRNAAVCNIAAPPLP